MYLLLIKKMHHCLLFKWFYVNTIVFPFDLYTARTSFHSWQHCSSWKLTIELFSCRYEHLAKSAPTILDDSLSADAYLNVLYMPSTFPRSERSRRSQEAPDSRSLLSSSDFEDGPRSGPRSNLDNVRYVECVNYLHEVSCKLFLFHSALLRMHLLAPCYECNDAVCILIHGTSTVTYFLT